MNRAILSIMRITTAFRILAFAAGVLTAAPAAARGQTEPTSASTEPVKPFTNKGFTTVQTTLQGWCAGCHGWARSYEGILRYVVPFHPEQSILFRVIASNRMPPDAKLASDQKALIYAWIKDGATMSRTPLTSLPPQGWLDTTGEGGDKEGAGDQ